MKLAHLLLLPSIAIAAHAAPVPLSDEELGRVSGKGVSFYVHLELNSSLLKGTPTDSRISAGFTVDGVTTWAIAQNMAGILDLYPVTIAPQQNADGTAYLAIGLPGTIAATQFGVRALAVQTDANAPIGASLGGILLNGAATMTGQLNLWAK